MDLFMNELELQRWWGRGFELKSKSIEELEWQCLLAAERDGQMTFGPGEELFLVGKEFYKLKK